MYSRKDFHNYFYWQSGSAVRTKKKKKKKMAKPLFLNSLKSYSRNSFAYTEYLVNSVECRLTVCQDMQDRCKKSS